MLAGRISLEGFLEELIFAEIGKQNKFHQKGVWAEAFLMEVKLSKGAEVGQ